MNKFKELTEAAGNLSDMTWKLLTLERDVTLHKAHPDRFTDEDKERTLTAYRMLSIAIYGQVRADRT